MSSKIASARSLEVAQSVAPEYFVPNAPSRCDTGQMKDASCITGRAAVLRLALFDKDEQLNRRRLRPLLVVHIRELRPACQIDAFVLDVLPRDGNAFDGLVHRAGANGDHLHALRLSCCVGDRAGKHLRVCRGRNLQALDVGRRLLVRRFTPSLLHDGHRESRRVRIVQVDELGLEGDIDVLGEFEVRARDADCFGCLVCRLRANGHQARALDGHARLRRDQLRCVTGVGLGANLGQVVPARDALDEVRKLASFGAIT
mmetsp:Transcript_2044/g.5213  ORF Transcript_2044/g.5213 Transcript_2044/m.5213 type:complete len:258 (+) Transcript_2044:238-1011(+)|eukprot:CAMPEP_0119406670 /NCGR_PEP_ID=MMETSP1335-20130426/908_1 /TAXON_ID=259385 /ORGANISM="Chrysoculter rhomboideus, Strain RCC1486" /LENGTH=257 /DNA_ID=CAMNT_0007430759 /DNA_START=189 /DNA_END=962 /DNA_ORIENTATION=-